MTRDDAAQAKARLAEFGAGARALPGIITCSQGGPPAWWRALYAVARRLNRFLMEHG